MQQFSKKFLALLLTLCMLMSFAPISAFAAEANAEVVDQQIMLGDDLTMHFYTKVENAANATAVISVGGVERAAYSLAAMTAGENGYDLSVSLAPAEMTETVSLIVLDGETQLLQNTYSVCEYAKYLLENNYTDETKAMAKELLNYGAKAQLYFGHKTGELANAGYEMETAAAVPAETAAPVVNDALTGINFYGASMVFDSKIAVRFYFVAENGVEDYTFAVEGKEITDGEKDGKYYIEVADIDPDGMDTALNVSVTKGEEALSFSYSPNSYIIRMYNNASSSQTLKDLLKAAYGYFEAAKAFSGVKENRTGSMTMAYRYGTGSLIQVNTDLPSDTPCVNFTAGQNGCSIDESANQYQNSGWIGMDNVDGTIVLTFHFNAAFEAGQTYVLPKGAVFGFTDGSKYTLDKNYTFTFDGSGWTMEAAEPAVTMQYRWGNSNTIQYNTNLPATTPLNNFLADANGCNLIQNGDQVVGWIGMADANGTIVLTFNFNSAFQAGQSYTLAKGSVFGFTDGSKFQLTEDVTLYFDGSGWTAEAPAKEITLQYHWGNANLIQYNTNLPATTPVKDFLATDNGCNLIQSGDQVVGYVAMIDADGTIVLTFNFNSAFEAGQSYTLSAGSVFGFTDGSKYQLNEDVTLYFDGSGWTTQEPAKEITLQYRWGNANTLQYNTNLPADIPCANFLASDNGCALVQSGDQTVGWIGMANANDTIVLTFNFNSDFSVGQSYTLAAGSVFGFTDGSTYILPADVTLYYDGSAWTAEEPAKEINLQYRWGNANLIQYNTNLPSDTPCVSFTAGDNGSNLIQTANQYQNVGWIGMENVDGVIVLTFHFNGEFTYGQSYVLSAGSVFGFTDGSSYTLPADVTLYYNGTAWATEEPPKLIDLQYRWGNANLIQYNTNLPSDTPCASFTASDNGSNLIQTANQYQNVGWIGMENVDGVIVLTFHFNADFAYGQSYILSAGSVFGFTDGSSYTLPADITLYWDDANWGETEPAPQKDPLEAENFTGGDVITFADVPADFTNSDKIQEYKELGFNTSLITEDHIGSYGVGAGNYYNVSVETVEPLDELNLQYHYGNANLIQIKTNLPVATPTANFTTGDNGCNVIQDGAQVVGWIQMNGLVGDVQLLTFHFNSAFEAGQSYILRAGSVFGFTDGRTYVLNGDYTFTWDGSNWIMTAPEGAPAAVTPITEKLDFQYRYGANNLIQVNTNLPATTPLNNFLADANGCNLIQNGDQVVGWIGMADANGTIVLTFNFNSAFQAGQSYTLAKGSVFGFTDGSTYTLDKDYTFTFDGSNWTMNTSVLSFSVNYVNGSTIQLKTNIPTGLTYGDFLLGDTSKGNVILETSEGAQAIGWFSYGVPGGADAVYWTFNLNGYNKPGAQYILKAGSSLIAGDKVYTTDRDYILTVNNAYLSSIENLDRAGLDIWVRNFTNKTGYFNDSTTKSLLLYKDVVDGFYIVDEAFQNSDLLATAGQQDITTDISALSTDLVGWFNTNFAGKYLHANHVPINSYDHYTGANGETLSQLDVAGYRNFLENYKTLFNDQVTASGSSIGFDNYPFVREQTILYSGISEDYLLNGLVAAQVAGQYDLSICVQTFEASGKKLFGQDTTRDITSSAEVSLQLNTGFALGADVFEYFAYNNAGQFNAIMNSDGSKRIYDIVKEGNQALCFADVVGCFTWNGIVTSAGTNNNHNSSAFTKVEDMVLTNISNGALNSYTSTDDAIIGCFTKDDLNGYMIVNYNDPKAVTGNNTVNVSFENCTRARVYTEVDGVLTSEIVELTNGSYETVLAPGAACFIIPA